MKLPTRNIFLDTNIYEENNFFHSNNIQSLFYYSRIRVINLYMTTISVMELVERMKKALIDAKEEHNKLVSAINKTRILRNLSEYESIEKSKITVEKSIAELSKKLDVIINSSAIKIISAENINIENIFELYYKKEPPFSISSKKYEFPDAFIIKSVDSWCKINKRKMVFVTKDLNFEGYKSKHLIFKNDLSELLSEISAYFDSKQQNQYIPYITESIKSNELAILDLIDSEITNLFHLDLDFESISTINRTKVKFVEYKISSIRPLYAEITYYVELNFSFTVFPTQIEIEKSIFSDILKPQTITQSKIIPCDLEVNLKRTNDIKLKRINSNQKFFISIEE